MRKPYGKAWAERGCDRRSVNKVFQSRFGLMTAAVKGRIPGEDAHTGALEDFQ